MKRIFAIVNEDMVDPTRKLLNDIGITSIHTIHALGKGNYIKNKAQKINTPLLKSEIAHYCLNSKGLITDSVMRKNRNLIERELKHGFHPKRMVIFTAHDNEIMNVIYKLNIMYAGWGRGKGKIFVCPIPDETINFDNVS